MPNQPCNSSEKNSGQLKSTSNWKKDEFQNSAFAKKDLLNGKRCMKANQLKFGKDISMEQVLEYCQEVREIIIGLSRRLYVIFLHSHKDNSVSVLVQI